MKIIEIRTQKQFDKLPNKFNGYTVIKIKNDDNVYIKINKALDNATVEALDNATVEALGNATVEALGNATVRAWDNATVRAWDNATVEAWGNTTVRALDNATVEAWGNATVEAWGNATVEAWDNATVEALGNATVRAWDNATVEALGNATVEALGNATVRAWDNATVEALDNTTVRALDNATVEALDNATVEAWGNATVRAWGNAVVRIFSSLVKIVLFGFSVAILPINCNVKVEKKSKTVIVQKTRKQNWFDLNGIEKKAKVILYKRVSKDFKTQEHTKNETSWEIGSVVEHPSWKPKDNECGEGKFHACSQPHFCDEFRSEQGGKYIAIEIATKDTYEWENPCFPHKIAFRKGKVLHEVDSFGKKIT